MVGFTKNLMIRFQPRIHYFRHLVRWVAHLAFGMHIHIFCTESQGSHSVSVPKLFCPYKRLDHRQTDSAFAIDCNRIKDFKISTVTGEVLLKSVVWGRGEETGRVEYWE